MTEASLRHYAAVIEQAVDSAAASQRPDAILSISSQCLARLHTAVPTCMFHDAPWLAFKQTYAPWESVPIPARRFARAEAEAARRTRMVFTGSAWSIAESMRLYSLPPDRFTETHLGANWTPTQSTPQLLALAAARARSVAAGAPLQLLFLGKDWQRKGGPLAVEVATALHAQGRPVQLHIVGCTPPLPESARAFTTVHGVLDLGNPEHRTRLEAIFLASHFLLVPTQAECFGIAFAEAQAFAVPPVSRRIHALPSIVLDGETGLLLPPEASAADYARRILEFVTERDLYLPLATQARARFEAELTWDHAAQVIVRGIEQTL